MDPFTLGAIHTTGGPPAMTEITRAEFDALRQKVEEIHRMLVNMGGQPNVIMVQPMVPQTEAVTVTIPTYREAIGAATRAFYEGVKP
jgi:hypothetical protein